MAEPLTDQTGPLDAGHTTTEWTGNKSVVILSGIIATLGTVLTVLDMVTTVVPPASKGLGLWLAIGGVAVGAAKQIAYEIQRVVLKIKGLQSGVRVAAGTDPAAVAPAAASAAANVLTP